MGQIDSRLKPLEMCQACGAWIYPGEQVYVVQGYIIHATTECLFSFYNVKKTTIEDALELSELPLITVSLPEEDKNRKK